MWLAAAGLLAGCVGGAGGSGAGAAVERYYRALAEKNAEVMIQNSCAAWEESAQREFDAFAGVQTKLDAITCAEAGKDGDYTLVTCTGKIQATYGTELQEFDLSGIQYKTLEEGGDWRMCGY
jgi:hypothetical protein